MVAEKPASPRIFRLRYRSALGRKRVVDGYIKVPYAGLFGLVDTLTRAMSTGQIMWYRLDVAHTGEITPMIRKGLVRWNELLDHTASITEVDWTR